MQGTELYTVNEAAKLIGVNPVTVRRYIRKGVIKPENKGNQYLITKGDIQKLPRKPMIAYNSIDHATQGFDIEPTQELLAQINKTFVQFSEQNAATSQRIAQEYRNAVRPLVQKAAGEDNPEVAYDTLKEELMTLIQRPIHIMVTNMLLIKKAISEHPELEKMSLTDALDWFITNLLRGVDVDGIRFSEPIKKIMKETLLQQE